jgi:Rrf2 family nitric oxide-sensitive transcriptional repressor
MDRHTLASITGGSTGEQIVQMHKMFWSGTTAGTA